MRRLETDRYLVLARQLIQEHGSRNAAAAKLGVDPSYLSTLQGDPSRNVGLDVIKRARETLSLRAEFFEDDSLGAAPDYRSFVGAGATRVDREIRQALQDFIESFDPDDAKAPDAEEAAWLEGLSFRELREAGLEVTPSMYDRLLRERRAQQAGKIKRAPVVEPPQPRPGRRKAGRR